MASSSDNQANAAAQAVFDVPELLEHVLLELPELSILASATRVCWQWKSAIDNSPNIQEKLFFRAGRNAVVPCNPVGWDDDDQPFYKASLRMNPALPSLRKDAKHLQQHIPNWFHSAALRNKDIGKNFTGPNSQAKHVELSLLRGGLDDLRQPGPFAQTDVASWHKMFITDPPCTTVAVSVRCICREDRLLLDEVELFVMDRGGVRMGLLEKSLQDVWGDLRVQYEHDDWSDKSTSSHVCFAELSNSQSAEAGAA